MSIKILIDKIKPLVVDILVQKDLCTRLETANEKSKTFKELVNKVYAANLPSFVTQGGLGTGANYSYATHTLAIDPTRTANEMFWGIMFESGNVERREDYKVMFARQVGNLVIGSHENVLVNYGTLMATVEGEVTFKFTMIVLELTLPSFSPSAFPATDRDAAAQNCVQALQRATQKTPQKLSEYNQQVVHPNHIESNKKLFAADTVITSHNSNATVNTRFHLTSRDLYVYDAIESFAADTAAKVCKSLASSNLKRLNLTATGLGGTLTVDQFAEKVKAWWPGVQAADCPGAVYKAVVQEAPTKLGHATAVFRLGLTGEFDTIASGQVAALPVFPA